MVILLDGVTTNTSPVTHRDPYAGNPSFSVDISGGTATVTIYQGNDPDNLHAVDSVTSSGIYSLSGIGDYYAAEASSVSGATVTVVASVKASLLSNSPLHPDDI